MVGGIAWNKNSGTNNLLQIKIVNKKNQIKRENDLNELINKQQWNQKREN